VPGLAYKQAAALVLLYTLAVHSQTETPYRSAPLNLHYQVRGDQEAFLSQELLPLANLYFPG